jgi:hypothetical protein
MRFRLRTLLIVLALGPPMLAALWAYYLWSLGTDMDVIGPDRSLPVIPLPVISDE